VQAAGGATRTKLRDRGRSAGQRAREIGSKLRLRAAQTRDEAQAVVRRITGELAGLAEKAATEAEQLLVNARRALRRAQAKAGELAAFGIHDAAAGRRRGRLRRAVNDLADLLAATRRIAAQTRQRLSGTTPDGATRRVSLHDADARPIAKGRLGKPVEFGTSARIQHKRSATARHGRTWPDTTRSAPRLVLPGEGPLLVVTVLVPPAGFEPALPPPEGSTPSGRPCPRPAETHRREVRWPRRPHAFSTAWSSTRSVHSS
jgi:hypothetical protein